MVPDNSNGRQYVGESLLDGLMTAHVSKIERYLEKTYKGVKIWGQELTPNQPDFHRYLNIP